MIWKLLLTALVIAGAVMALRLRNRQMPPPTAPATGALPSPSSRTPLMRVAAFALMFIMIIGSGFFLYLQWQENYRVITVHVIDTRTGRDVTYEAYKGDIEDRSFITLSGRQVNLAEVERMELTLE